MNLWWIRRNLRLSDNPALAVALAQGVGVIPAFMLDGCLLEKPAPKRQASLFAALRSLEKELNQRGLGWSCAAVTRLMKYPAWQQRAPRLRCSLRKTTLPTR